MSLLVRSIREVSGCFQQSVIKPSELLDLCLQRLQKTMNLNAFITVTPELARQQALASDKRLKEGKRLGVLDGIPVAVKDNFSTKGVKTSCGSKMLANYIPPYNATAVQRLCDQGAVIIGKTNMDEFAMGSGTVDSIYGPTKNPHCYGLSYKLNSRQAKKTRDDGINSKRKFFENDWHIPGGSSGGSAVALASGTCFGALGSDTGGSTRNPASRCGVIGFKPTYGLVSRHGLIPLTNSMDVPGILAKTVDDAALLLAALGGHDILDSTTVPDSFRPFHLPNEISLAGFHIGIPKEYHCPGLSKETVDIWGKVADILENNGAKVTSVSMPHTQHSIVCYSVLNCCEVASNFARYDGIEYGHRSNENDCSSVEDLYAATRHEGFSEIVRGRIIAGNYFLLRSNYEKYFVQALKVRRLIAQDFDHVFENGVNLLLTPVTLTEAPLYSQWIKKDNREQVSTEDFCTQPVNMAGVPAISFPCSFSSSGLPLSLQLIGKQFKEEELLTVAKWLEQELNFPVWDLDEG